MENVLAKSIEKLVNTIEVLQRQIRRVSDSEDYPLMCKFINTQVELLTLLLPYVKQEIEPEPISFPHLRQALEEIPPELLNQILKKLDEQ